MLTVACITAAWAGVIVAALTLAVLTLTLLSIKEYTGATREQVDVSERTARAAARQAEAAIMPVIVVHAVHDPSEDALIDSMAADAVVYPAVPHGPLVLMNVGSGPALALSYRVNNLDSRDHPSMHREGFVVPRGDRLPTMFVDRHLLPEADILVLYESASGATYQTVAHFEVHQSDDGDKVVRIAGHRVQRLSGLEGLNASARLPAGHPSDDS